MEFTARPHAKICLGRMGNQRWSGQIQRGSLKPLESPTWYILGLLSNGVAIDGIALLKPLLTPWQWFLLYLLK